MPYRVTVEKYHSTSAEYWTNVYFVAATTLANAKATADEIVANERVIHLPGVLFTKYRVDDAVPNTDNYLTQAINLSGTSNAAGDMMPLFVCARADINVNGPGRPSRKYYRGALTEAMVSGMTITDTTRLTEWSTGLTSALTTLLVDPQNQQFSSVTFRPQVGMRQLRRGSKKKVTP